MRAIDIIMSKRFGKGKKGMVIGWPELLKVAGGTATDIVGATPPITLADAIKGKIVKLTQYGFCDQSGTPTLSAPVDILCNNGTLKMVDGELPVGYKRLTGIRFDGNTWYETGEALTGDDDVTMTLDNTASQGQNVFGSYNGTASGNKNFSLFIYGNGSTSNSYFRYGEQLLRPRFGTGERTITFGRSGTDGFAMDATVTPDTFQTPANAYIGMLPNSTSPAYTGDIKGNIAAGTRLKWIPCERESDGVIGYYEASKGNFIAPSGTGTPTSLGYDGTHYTLAVVGTDEVISVRGKNLYNAATRVDGYYLSSGGVPTAADGSSYSAAIPIKYGQTITFSGISGKAGSNNKRIKWYTNDDEPSASNVISSPDPIAVEGAGVPYSKTFSVWDNRAKFMRISFNTADTNVMVEIGGTVTDYAPYTEQTATAPNLFAVGDYADEVEIISGGITRGVGIKVFDGTESIDARSSSVDVASYGYNLPDAVSSASGRLRVAPLCTHFAGVATTTPSATQVQYWTETQVTPSGIEITTKRLSFFVDKTQYGSDDAWKAYLAEQYAAGTPVIVLYPLAEETTESVTPQPLHTNAGDNVISVTANVSPIEFDVTYMKGA